MKLISSSKALEKEFLRLLNQYKEYYWLSAWAGVNTKAFEKLDENRDRIKKLVIGIHFYQTHPDFIKAFLDEDSVHYVMQPEGIFHPKLYLFYTSPEEWEVITGSANFTNSAFTKNTEISTLITSEEPNADKLLKQIMGLVDSNWSTESNFSSEQYKNYKTTWQNQKRKLKSISGNYHESHRKTPTPAFEVPIMNMPWEEFCKKIQDKEGGGLENRLSLLDYVQKLFKENNSFADLSLEDRCIIAGTPNKSDKDFDYRFFGSMKGNGNFNHCINEDYKGISNALDQIPLYGQITKHHYDKFVEIYSHSLEGNPIATATRLLAMKRPDVFICLDGKNKKELCEDFNISKGNFNYERYWDEIIARIQDSVWWQHSLPKTEKEKEINKYRTAMLDVLYYNRK